MVREDVVELRKYFSAWTVGQLVFPDVEKKKAALRVAREVWKYKRRRVRRDAGVSINEEYPATVEPEAGWGERAAPVDHDGVAGTLHTVDMRKRGLLSYEEEIHAATRLFLHALYKQFVAHLDESGRLWQSLLFYNRKLYSKVFERRPSSRMSARKIAYFYVLLLRVYIDEPRRALREVLDRIRETYGLDGKQLAEMLSLLAETL